MKYIKLYEKLKKPKIGDYIICKEENINDEALTNFLLSNIGQIYKFNYGSYNLGKLYAYVVEYNNIPKDLEINFREYPEYDKNNLITILPKEIVAFSQNKEDLGIYINKMKYNL